MMGLFSKRRGVKHVRRNNNIQIMINGGDAIFNGNDDGDINWLAHLMNWFTLFVKYERDFL